METLLSRAEIPIIDLAHTGTAETPVKCTVRRIAAQLHRSLSQKGLALLVNHGIADEKLRAVYNVLDKFCDLPNEEKNKYLRTPPHNHGYVAPGVEKFMQDRVEEVRHTFNVVWLERNLPEAQVPGFQAAVSSLAQDFRRLATLLLRALATGLELQPDFFMTTHTNMLQEGNETCMRLLYYPPVGAPPTPGITRCGEHSDYGTFTLLAQDSEGGLEMLTPNHRWGRVGHLPGAILINTGELLASWTGGKYPALRHRVVVPEQPMTRCRGRHCVAFFVHPDNDTPIEPIKSPVLAEQPVATKQPAPLTTSKPASKHGTIYTAYQHLQMRFRETYA